MFVYVCQGLRVRGWWFVHVKWSRTKMIFSARSMASMRRQNLNQKNDCRDASTVHQQHPATACDVFIRSFSLFDLVLNMHSTELTHYFLSNFNFSTFFELNCKM